MPRLKTKHSYHDAEIRAVDFEAGDCVVFEIDYVVAAAVRARLSICRSTTSKTSARFEASSNQYWREQRSKDGSRRSIGLLRDDVRRFLTDLDHGALYIKAKGFTET